MKKIFNYLFFSFVSVLLFCAWAQPVPKTKFMSPQSISNAAYTPKLTGDITNTIIVQTSTLPPVNSFKGYVYLTIYYIVLALLIWGGYNIYKFLKGYKIQISPKSALKQPKRLTYGDTTGIGTATEKTVSGTVPVVTTDSTKTVTS